ncbi:MAG: hypothetical protein AB8G95_07060 [Anaerolineae bacterium]
MLKKSWFYPVIAGIYDVYIFAFYYGAILALYALLQKQNISVIAALTLATLPFIVSAIYHIFISRRTFWRSPGEIIVGRQIRNEEKIWTNPYGWNRWALFLMLIFTVAFAGNAWDKFGLDLDIPYLLPEIFSKVLALTITAYSVIQVGKGRIWIGLILVIQSILGSISQRNESVLGIPPEVMETVAFFLLGIGAFQLIIVLIYAALKKSKSTPKPISPNPN